MIAPLHALTCFYVIEANSGADPGGPFDFNIALSVNEQARDVMGEGRLAALTL